MSIVSKNPATEEVIRKYEPISKDKLKNKITKSDIAYKSWKTLSIKDRIEKIQDLKKVFTEKRDEFAEIITKEMGKPISVSRGEVEKCQWNMDHYSENAEEYLQDEIIETEADKSYITFDPVGIVFLVMPWNYPFWQAIRPSVPALIAGNTILLKHASNVAGSALALESAFQEAGFPEGVFQTLLIESEQVEDVISDFRVRGVSLTGSTSAGSAVASLAGKYIKPSVLELGGSDPFIVFDDADMDKALTYCRNARMKNSGQVCNSPKRVIIMKSKHDEFVEKLKERYETIKIGDPMNEETEMGPMVSARQLEEVEKQVNESIEKGAKLIMGGKRLDKKGYYYPPTILTNVQEGMPAYEEEIFGPVTSVISVDTEEEAIRIANDNQYGLGASIWTKDKKRAEKLVHRINAGAVYINKTVSSDPRLPIGGIKNSGYGKELSEYGIKEFTNEKSIWIE